MIFKIPIELNEKQIKEFQEIYKSKYGKDISRDEAIKEGLNLVGLIALIIREN